MLNGERLHLESQLSPPRLCCRMVRAIDVEHDGAQLDVDATDCFSCESTPIRRPVGREVRVTSVRPHECRGERHHESALTISSTWPASHVAI
ncbi:MAG TPA: hypothetical protein VF637_17225, partial [Sphingomicrobium sp.]